MRKRWIGPLVLLALFVWAPVHADSGAVEARGQVEDAEGNPVPGALLTFSPQDNPGLKYTTKTNKKGRYFVAGMYSSQGDMWDVTLEAEGYLPVKVVIESRTANRVLVGDIQTKTLKAGSKIPSVLIRKLGSAKLDFTLAPENEVLAQARAEAEARAAAEGGAKKVQPQRDPWDEALQLASSGDLEGSIAFFERAIKAEPQNAERHEALAKVLYQVERLDEAEAQALKAVEIAPQGVGPRLVLYSVYVSRGELDRGQETLEEANRAAPDDVRVLERLAYLAGETGNSDDAIAAYERVAQADPGNTNAWMFLGDLYAAAGDNEESEQAYRRVSELDPGNAHQVFFNLGALIINKPNRSNAETKKAINAFRKALELKPDYAQAHKQLAFALLGVGDRSGAKDSLEHYILNAPDAPDTAQMRQLVKTLN